jgi:hypothetical protein
VEQTLGEYLSIEVQGYKCDSSKVLQVLVQSSHRINIWVLLRWLTTRLIARGPARWEEDAFSLFRFIAFLRRAIEYTFGTIDSIPIYSW